MASSHILAAGTHVYLLQVTGQGSCFNEGLSKHCHMITVAALLIAQTPSVDFRESRWNGGIDGAVKARPPHVTHTRSYNNSGDQQYKPHPTSHTHVPITTVEVSSINLSPAPPHTHTFTFL